MIIKTKKIILRAVLILFLLFLVLGIFLTVKQPKTEVLQTIPQNRAEEVSEKADIVIVFNRELASEDETKISLETVPKESFRIVRFQNQIAASPKTVFKAGTNYSVVVKFEGKEIYTFSFETTPFSEKQILEEGKLQSQDDLEYGEVFKKFAEEYPWYLGLPIETIEYRIVYDFEQESFRIRMKIPIIEEGVEENLVKAALENLKEIGVPEPISYYVLK